MISNWSQQQRISEAINCTDGRISNEHLSAVIIWDLDGWFSLCFYCPENTNIWHKWCVNGFLSKCTVWLACCPFLMYQNKVLCFVGRCHVLHEAMTGTEHASGHQGPFSNQLYKWTSVKSRGDVINHPPRLSRGAAGVCVESSTHTDPYKRLCDVLEQMSGGPLWHMTDSSFDSPRKVCREVSI